MAIPVDRGASRCGDAMPFGCHRWHRPVL